MGVGARWGQVGWGQMGAGARWGSWGGQMGVEPDGGGGGKTGMGPDGGWGPIWYLIPYLVPHPLSHTPSHIWYPVPLSGIPIQIGVPPGISGWHETTLTSHQSGMLHSLIFSTRMITICNMRIMETHNRGLHLRFSILISEPSAIFNPCYLYVKPCDHPGHS